MDSRQSGDGDGCGGDRDRAARLAGLVRGHRRAAGLTQGRLASLSGVSVAAIRDLEQGRRHRPRPGSLARLAGVLGLDAAQAGELAAVARGGSGMAPGAVGQAGPGRGGPGRAGVGRAGVAGGVRLQVLGPLVAWRDGVRLALGGPRQQAVLGMLALAPGSLVHRAAIIDALWPGDPPATAVTVVQSHVSRLRGLLDRGRLPRDRGGVLVSAGACYGLRAGPGQLDLLDFAQLAAGARAAREAGDYAGACGLYQRALGLWRGEPLAGVDLLAGHPELAGLARQRAAMVIEYAQVASGAGWHDRVLAPLRALAGREPLNERAHAQLMIALAGSGQQAEALELFEALRRRLDTELAMPPGPEVAEAHLRVLRQDIPPAPAAPAGAGTAAIPTGQRAAAPVGPTAPAVAPASGSAAAVSGSSPVPRQLPTGVRHFAGREQEIGKLDALAQEASGAAGTVVISAIGGTAGVGKTALALHWAHRVADRFPDGQLYVNLRGFGPSAAPVTPGEAIRGFLSALGVAGERVPAELEEQAGLYRSLLAGRRMLIVADNARDEAQVRPLLPASSGCLVLVTSRLRLGGLVAAEGAHAITLDVLTQAEAGDLLARRLGAGRVAAEPGPAAEIIGLCTRLPLALAVTAARAAAYPGFPLAALAAGLRDEQDRLTALDAGETATSVRAAFSWSYRHLTPAAARIFRLLGLHPGPDVSLAAAASLAGVSHKEARAILAELTAAHLLTEHVPDRLACHDLLRAYAAEQAEALTSDTERRAAVHRLLGHYLHSARAADRQLYPARPPIDVEPPAAGTSAERFAGHAQALAWFDAEHQVLLATIALAARQGFDACAWQLAWTLETFLYRRDHLTDWAATQRTALAAARRLGDRNGQACAHRGIANALLLGDCHGADAHLRQAMMLRRQAGDRAGQAVLLVDFSRLHERERRYRQAVSSARKALGIYRELGDRRGEAIALNHVGWTLGLVGRFEQAFAHCQQALVIMLAIGDHHHVPSALDSLGYAHRHLGDHARAAACYRRAVHLYAELGNRYKRAETLGYAGDAYRAAGDPLAARDAWQEALHILDELHHPDAGQLRAKLHALATGGPPGRESSPPPPAAARR
jgi:DNA-binding SARP family transcriptional activator/DNA-binding XRE family transcriptional regulator